MNKPYLIQRLRPSVRQGHHGIDRHFSMEYMGSAEFEFGSVPAAIKRFRSEFERLKSVTGHEMEPIVLRTGNAEAWFVGSDELVSTALIFFQDQLSDKKDLLKEPSYIDRVYLPRDKWDTEIETRGWWCIDEGLEFAFFKTKDLALKWIEGLKNPKPKTSS